KKDLLHGLRERSFRSFPGRIPPASVRGKRTSEGDTTFILATESGTEGEVSCFAGKDGEDPTSGTLVLVNESILKDPGLQWARPCVGQSALAVMGYRGLNQTMWTTKSPPNYVERSHALVGRTVDEGRVWDVIATVRFLQAESAGKREWKVIGQGPDG